MTYKYTDYWSKLIETFDDFLPNDQFNRLHEEVTRLPYFYGERDSQWVAPAGLISDLNNSKIHEYLYEQVKDLETLKGLVHERTYVNYFSRGEPTTYHDDNTSRTLLFYFNTTWQLDEGGETKFSIDPKLINGIECSGSEDYPIILSIAPIPNRMVMFRGDLIHCATSFKSQGRFTLAMKFKEPK
jgi:hypothetical protein